MALLSWLDALPGRLWQFWLDTVLPAVPRAAWWIAGSMLFCILNLVFEKEIWPHHKQIGNAFCVGILGGVFSLPWLAARAAARISWEVTGLWKLLWQFLTWGLYFLAVLSAVLFIVLGCIAIRSA
ncbi:hypothetical protein [Hymenobacter rigui]|uniref:Uncharacterized protein n=1 Tax=Hymenobacter rigui TaxID=334424 RepID=A0A3R9P8W5_9BACT|nr:hypothetical protein [Hymenobacter rigui]RSK51438.1 hypothetical protein EI291_03770 [Hymenobacter rigui]